MEGRGLDIDPAVRRFSEVLTVSGGLHSIHVC